MKTLYLSAGEADTALTAAEIIRRGGLVALPTETVYGLGADGLNPEAVKKIFAAKGRPQDNPLILHICDASQIRDLCHDIPQSAWALAAAFWPGPLTMVLPARDVVPLSTRGGLSTVAVRCPDSDITRAIIRRSGVPIAAPSANISGKPSTTTAAHVRHDHDGRIDCVVDGGPCRVGVESTIIDLTEDPPRLLRPGGITIEELESVLGKITVDKAVTQSLRSDEVAKAPGMKYKHYAPQCEVVIVSGGRERAAQWVKRHWKTGDRVLCFEEELGLYGGCAPLAYGREEDPATLSAGLFDALRQLDDPSVGTVYARCPVGGGIAAAVRNRLSKAAAFRVMDADREAALGAHKVLPYEPPTKGSVGADLVSARAIDNDMDGGRLPPALRATPLINAGGGASVVIGITGGTGCGKTTLLNLIREKGGLVIDCDEVYHGLLRTDKAMLEAIGGRFPGCVAGGVLDRKKLGAIVFADPAALKELNAITHGAVKRAVVERLRSAPPLAAIDAIALFEGGLAELCGVTVAVVAPEDVRVTRLMARDGISEAYAKARIAAQPENAHFTALCDHTLENNGTQDDFQVKCLAFLNGLGIM